jgi:hypothetical protein
LSDLADNFEDVPELDARGLLPVEKARTILAGITAENPVAEFRDARGDELWRALLSLEDAAEFVREARRLAVRNQPRGHYNLSLFERYGAGIEPWLADRFDAATGTLTNEPWNVMPLLLEMSSERAFEIVSSITTLNSPTYDWDTPEKLHSAWTTRHLPIAAKVLATRALAGDGASGRLLQKLARERSRQTLTAIESALGAPAASALAARLKLVAKLEPDEITSALDAAAAKQDMYAWPRFSYDFEDTVEFSGLRLVAVRSTTDERWGIALERITGCAIDELVVHRFRYGSEVEPGRIFADEACSALLPVTLELDETSDTALGATIRSDAGAITLTKQLVQSLDLKPGKGSEPQGAVGGPAVVLLRAFLETFPGAIWPPVEATIAALGLDPSHSLVVACTDAFAHADGEKAPSTSKAYASAATAIVKSDPAAFKPGSPNTHWRKHAKHKA